MNKIPAISSHSSLHFRPEDQNEADNQIDNFTNQFLLKDTEYVIGLISLLVSFGLFAGSSRVFSSAYFFEDSFFFNFSIAAFYFLWLMVKGKMKFFWKAQEKEFQPHRILLWLIWLISCFALNKSAKVFNESTLWLSVAIIVSATICLLSAWEELFPKFLQKIFYSLLAASAILWAYYAIYLSWLYPFSIPGLLLFGIGLHSFIPLLLFIMHVRILYQKWNSYPLPILAGIISPLLFVLYFLIQWHIIHYNIRYTENDLATRADDELPAWIILGQTIGNDWITEKVIKGNLIYQTANPDFDFIPQSTNLGMLSQHDPLVLIASLFTPKTDLSEKERVKLLEVLFDARHYTQERLWSGYNLATENVITQARIYPEYRLAYTEKTISIGNHDGSEWDQEEALYTFYLPEGSVISSLSLWIDGKEEKGYLTTQTKSDSAYKTIVGVEQRDPSVIHWQEGNVVKIKVFPCTPKENRRFKIGITSPLKVENNKLVYENIYFQGPASDKATETIKLDFTRNINKLEIPFSAEKIQNKGILARGRYKQSWEAKFATVPLSSAGFTFNGKSYSIKPYQMIPESFPAKNIYLDINSSWTKSEFDELYKLSKNKSVYIYDEEFIELSDSNKDEIFEQLFAKRYTIFPVHKVADADSSLLITKGTATSPNLKDLQESQFGNALRNAMPDQSVLRTFNIGNVLSPYFKTLNELRIVRCEKTGFDEIKKLISLNQFPENQEIETNNKASVRIESAKMLIQESDSVVSQNAPDHLLRLFAYNHIMQQIGRNYLSQSYLKASETNTNLITEAAKANIITPVSSLIVLESQADYKRFDIKKSKNTLDNATLKKSGAVPEPHEWALIILFFLFVSYYTFRSYVR